MGPLAGIRIVEFAGIGPGPFAAMLLSDMGAEVVRIDRKGARGGRDLLNRGRRSVALDLKSAEGVETALALIERADGLVEGFRPGVMERLGLGPDVALARNPRLVYGRMTGWGQDGPLAHAAGHDINYIALTGALEAIGERGRKPVPPLNLVGDFGGGALYLAFGLVCGLIEARGSGKGQVVDAAMVDGAASLMTMFWSLRSAALPGFSLGARGEGMLAGGAPFYDTYETADGKWVAIGAIEPQFYALLREKAGLDDPAFDAQFDTAAWPALKAKVAEVFRTRTRAEWCALLEGTDACFAPVLTMDEVPDHPHNKARGIYVERDGVVQPAPAPRFSRTPGAIAGPPAEPGAHTEAVLADWGLGERIAALRASGAI
ncbi:MAG: CoA transferase [Alphaproteobacteria bacterium]|nr:CoA transferase [Alphaproteobacteria bacterium]